ncbi:PKD domain-containing protein [Variovorax sp. W6]|uniref:PKD domain-containing protein n=1 Tax=Variovorax sp. W6 TaxID=3093895 RepID=UPI003D803808
MVSSPVAVVTSPSSGALGQVFNLDGSTSTVASGKTKTYRWELRSKPSTSQAALVDSASAKPSLLLDVAGDYVVRLIVNDGERDSAPVDATITSVVPASTGPVLKFVLVETTTTPDSSRTASIQVCDAYRLDSHLADFWTPGLDASNCNSGLGLPADFQTQYRSAGSLPVVAGLFPGPLGEHSTVAAGAFPTDLPVTPIRMSYEVAANLTGLARTSIGKAGGTSLDYVVPGYRMYAPLSSPGSKATYRIAGAVAPLNAPQGWEAVVETTVNIDVTAYSGSTPTTKFNVYTKKFSADFSENVDVELDPSAYPQFAGDQGTYALSVSHQVAYKRKAN